MSPKVEMRLGTSADAPACNDFHNSYYGTSRTLAQWQWEFGRSPANNGSLPFVMALADSTVVGTQALIPIQLVDSRGAYWSGKSEETLVAESMRGGCRTLTPSEIIQEVDGWLGSRRIALADRAAL